MNKEQAKQLKKGTVILINHITGKDEIARVVGWDCRCDGIDYHAVSGGGSICKPEHIIKILDNNQWNASEVWRKAYKEYWGIEYGVKRN